MNVEEVYKNISLSRFLETLDQKNFVWIVKRLSGNDTGLTGGHQVGIYVPKFFMESVLPEVCNTTVPNPYKCFNCYIPSHDCLQEGVRAVYYNNRLLAENGTRNEFRITRWAGSPMQDAENTGSICILAALREGTTLTALCWVSKNAAEEDLIEYWIGREIEPAQMYNSRLLDAEKNIPIFKQLPISWFSEFPSGRQIFDFIEAKVPYLGWGKSIDELLLKRRSIEFEVFSEIERRNVLPDIKNGFESVDTFIKYSNSVANRRKSRAGTSLELHLENIFKHEKLKFETQAVTELNKKPDFLFPSKEAYSNPTYPEVRLHMLASKTCCKDRWRQVLNEADRIKTKHLFTLQEGVSSKQLNEMYHNGIVLVVPKTILKSFPADYRDQILNLTGFVEFIKTSQLPM